MRALHVEHSPSPRSRRSSCPLVDLASDRRRRDDASRGDVRERRRADPPAEVPGVSSAGLDRADVAAHLRRRRQQYADEIKDSVSRAR